MANYPTKHEKPEAMDEAISLTQQGCKLARELESNLHNLASQPNSLSTSIDEILKTFTSARRKLFSPDQIQIISSFAQMLPQAETQQVDANLLMQEWMRSGLFPQPVDLVQMQQQAQATRSTPAIGGMMEFNNQSIRSRGGRDVEGSERSRGSEGEVQPPEESPSRQRRRKDTDAQKETVVVRAPQYGNTEVPPEDGYTWRKYGQKEILGSKYPRSYYRCTHQKLCECPAKKQVQRLDSNPNLFHVTYRGNHTCHMSSTAPSSLPPRLLVNISRDTTQSTISPQSSTSSLSGWLSTAHLSLPGGSTMAPAAGDAGAGPSTSSSRYGGRGDNTSDYDPAVADLADAMFNSGSSSSNSMELIFKSEDKYEAGDKKS